MANKKIGKFYNFNFNEIKNETDLWLYGELISGGNDSKWSEDDVTFQDFKDSIDNMGSSNTLNIHVNSPGGSVFCSNAIISLLKSAKNTGITINSFIDSLGASCASWLPLVADNVYIYQGSILMLHRASAVVMGNADDMQQQIDLLNKIEDDIIIPMYMSKAKDGVTEQDFRDMMAKETWLTSQEIQDIFNVTLLDEEKQITACVDKDTMKDFINMPDNIKQLLNEKEEKDLENTKKVKIVPQEEETADNETINDADTKDLDTKKKVPKTTTKEQAQKQGDDDEEETNSCKEDDVEDKKAKPCCNEEDTEVEDSEKEAEDKCKKDEPKTSNTSEKDVEDKLNESNEKVIALNDKVQELLTMISSLQPIVNEYNAKKEAEVKAEKEATLEKTTNLYKNKFEKVGASDKFKSKEVQDLIANSCEDEGNLAKLNAMLVDLISIGNTTNSTIVRKFVSEMGTSVEDLIPTENKLSSLFE